MGCGCSPGASPLTHLAHFGVYGALGEAALALALAGLFVWIWLRERRKSRERGDEPAEMNELDEDGSPWSDESDAPRSP